MHEDTRAAHHCLRPGRRESAARTLLGGLGRGGALAEWGGAPNIPKVRRSPPRGRRFEHPRVVTRRPNIPRTPSKIPEDAHDCREVGRPRGSPSKMTKVFEDSASCAG